MNQTWENGKKANSGPDFGPFWPKFGPQRHFSWILLPLDVRNCCNLSLYAISRKTNELNLIKWQKTWFWPWFWPIFAQIWSPKFFLVGFTSTRCYKLFQAIIVCYLKENWWTKFERMPKYLVSGPNLVPQIFFSWILPLLDVRNFCKLSSLYAISRQSN